MDPAAEECASLGGTWNSSTSKCTRTQNCSSKPANTVWNTVSSITQTWNGSSWQPVATSSYNASGSSQYCYYKCAEGYEWNGSACSVSYSVGEIVTFGKYEQDNNTGNGKEAIEWRVLAVNGNKALLLSQKGLYAARFAASSNSWSASEIRSSLSNHFIPTAFTSEEQAKIQSTTLSDVGTTDKVFLLSKSEVEQYFAGNCDRLVYPTAYAKANGAYTSPSTSYCSGNSYGAGFWWLRSAGSSSGNAMRVSYGGDIDYYGVSYANFVVRPALWMQF